MRDYNDRPGEKFGSEDASWTQCRPGMLSEKSESTIASRRRRRILLIGGTAVLVLSAVGLRLLSDSNAIPGDRVYADISCSEVRENLPQYRNGQVEAALKAKIEAHLKLCPFCKAYVSHAVRPNHDYLVANR